MARIRRRFDLIRQLQTLGRGNFTVSETIAFHLRKIVEGAAFGCLIACQNGLKAIPKDAQGQWNADTILARLAKRQVNVLPNPSILRAATPDEQKQHIVNAVVEGQPEKCLDSSEIREIYRKLHAWLHERNPYVGDHASFLADGEDNLWAAVEKLWNLLAKHFISISGEAFFCVLVDDVDGETKVIAASKAAV